MFMVMLNILKPHTRKVTKLKLRVSLLCKDYCALMFHPFYDKIREGTPWEGLLPIVEDKMAEYALYDTEKELRRVFFQLRAFELLDSDFDKYKNMMPAGP